MDELFDTPASPQDPSPPPGAVAAVGVALAANVWSSFDYAWPISWPAPQLGLRVRVPFGRGNTPTLGFVVRVGEPHTDRKLKCCADLLDREPQLDAELMALARWIAEYYLTPLGLVLPAMVPSAVGRHASRSEQIAFLLAGPDAWPAQLGLRQKKVLDELQEARKQGLEGIPVSQLTRRAGGGRDTIARLSQRELIRLETRPVVLTDLTTQIDADPFDLNAEQQTAADGIVERLGKGFAPILLQGVTGSGKTEVYVRAIRAAVEAGGQAILLAPEIALATQTLQRLLKRLPRVAVLHSQLTDAQRAFYYEQIRDGHAAVVVGPRSAVFAPTRKLALVIVDEEHETSYKQDSAPRYNARDVAVKRAHLAGVPVVMGTATPSLETLLNVQRGRYTRLSLPHRVKSLPLPRLEMVHLRKDLTGDRIELIGRTLTGRIAATLDRREQIILLMNRRGYASYVFCPSCQWQMQCDDCTRAMVYHQAMQLAMCHYCQRTSGLPERCPACQKRLVLFGLGIQRIEDELSRKFPVARVARMDSDTMSSAKQFEKLLADFREGLIDILLGTQMVAKGLDFPRVTLVGVVSADTALAIPDFRSAERTFQLVVQVAGRAGRAEAGGQVIVQTLHPDEPAILAALKHDVDGFAATELPNRQAVGLPPYTRLVRLLVRHEHIERCEEAAVKLAGRLATLLPPEAGIKLTGPVQAPVARVRKQYRWQILLSSPNPGTIQKYLSPRMDELARSLPAEMIADVDPTSLA